MEKHILYGVFLFLIFLSDKFEHFYFVSTESTGLHIC